MKKELPNQVSGKSLRCVVQTFAFCSLLCLEVLFKVSTTRSWLKSLCELMRYDTVIRNNKNADIQGYAMKGEDILTYGHFWALSYMLLAVLRPITMLCQYYGFGLVCERLSTRLRVKSFQHLLSLPCEFYDDPKHSATKLSNRLNTDASNVKGAVDDRLGSVLMTLTACAVAVISAAFYSWKMTLEAGYHRSDRTNNCFSRFSALFHSCGWPSTSTKSQWKVQFLQMRWHLKTVTE